MDFRASLENRQVAVLELKATIAVKYLTTAFFRSAKNCRISEFRVRNVVPAPVGRFKFDQRTVKLKQEILKRKVCRFDHLDELPA